MEISKEKQIYIDTIMWPNMPKSELGRYKILHLQNIFSLKPKVNSTINYKIWRNYDLSISWM